MEKIAVVTGSSKGLGKALVLALSRYGFTVVIHYNQSQKEAGKLLEQLKVKSPDSTKLKADLKIEKDVESMFRQILSKYGRIDLLINNVGNFLYKPFGATTNSEFKDVFETNVYASLFCSRAVLPAMRKQKSGQIINIGSVGAERITILENSTPYYIAKNALYSLTKIMAHDEAKKGIHINMISPASLETDIFDKSDFPMGRCANYEDVIKVLLFLISDDAYYINGANIEVAGGFIPGLKSK